MNMTTQTPKWITETRLFDLVRYCRGELHEAGLITDQEYADLVTAGSESARRLENYDELRAKIAELEKDKARLDWLIKQGPPSEDDEFGLSEEVWNVATEYADPDDRESSTDNICVRKAIDAATAALNQPSQP